MKKIYLASVLLLVFAVLMTYRSSVTASFATPSGGAAGLGTVTEITAGTGLKAGMFNPITDWGTISQIVGLPHPI